MLKQDENGLKIDKTCVLPCELFFGRKNPVCYCRGKINKHTTRECLFYSPNDVKVLTCSTTMKPFSQNRGE